MSNLESSIVLMKGYLEKNQDTATKEKREWKQVYHHAWILSVDDFYQHQPQTSDQQPQASTQN